MLLLLLVLSKRSSLSGIFYLVCVLCKRVLAELASNRSLISCKGTGGQIDLLQPLFGDLLIRSVTLVEIGGESSFLTFLACLVWKVLY